MSSYQTSRIFVVGGTGAQGIPVVRGLVKDKKYFCRILTRDGKSARAQQLLALGNVELVEGTFASEQDLRNGFRGCDGAFVNIDGFNCGEKTEIYWTIRAYELAIEEGIKFYVHGNLDYVYKKSGFDPKFRTGHYDAKGRMSEWLLEQNKQNGNRMGAASFTTGPYIEMSISSNTMFTPSIENGTATWRVPLGEHGGGVVHVALDDCEYYVRWMFDNPDRIAGQDLEVAIDHISYHDLAKAFTKVTGHPAQYIDTTLEDFWATGPMAPIADQPCGYNNDKNDPATFTNRLNFTGFLNMWKYSHGNDEKAIIKRDYKLLDEIFPSRIKTAEEWFRREDAKGREQGKGDLWQRVQRENLKPILKIAEDKRRGRL
ncbi:uncharacterized protein AB675_1431 [Cyphellophora attinorum]|uniref:NmrA-like domain-containing protein n=1 Tax=Cyphellophora attinorum TaxID=1664694 RepID=A0A0N1H5X2_9EURO|nr:uncharacterized protein AB675_1431 [Phialophora attinorum]KPI37305.1 hypothetical protein AB675_1431 [Phialophora attinorum]